MAREYEVTQLVQLLQTMGQDSPFYGLLIKAIVDNMNISNRDELIAQIEQSSQPDPEQQALQQANIEADMALKQANVKLYESQAAENASKAAKNQAEIQMMPQELELDKLKLATHNLKEGYDDDKEFTQRLKIAELALKEKEIDMKAKENDTISRLVGSSES